MADAMHVQIWGKPVTNITELWHLVHNKVSTKTILDLIPETIKLTHPAQGHFEYLK